jgi:hypothetical protein
MLFRAILVSVLLGLASGANAQITITNFNSGGTALANQITHHDTAGDRIDATDGNILQVGTCPGTGCAFYQYATPHDCGFRYSDFSAWCGIRVYKSTDLINWNNLGYLFDGSTPYWQARCGGATSFNGCFQSYAVYNAANNNYVVWLNQGAATNTPVAANSQFVFVCATPFGGCTQQADPSHLSHASGGAGAVYPYVDQSTGTAYGIYPNIVSREIYIDQLNANYTDSTGTFVDVGVTGEANWLLKVGSTWYASYGGLCGYCSTGATTTVLSATSALGTYGSSVTINSNSCLGQNTAGVATIVAGGSTTYLYRSNQYNGLANQGLSNIYVQPLSFTGSAMNTFSCNATISVPGLVLAGTYPTPAYPTPLADQSDVQDGVFNDHCDISATTWRMQTFVPTQASLFSVGLALGINHTPGDAACAAAGLCTGTNGSLEIDIDNVNGSNVPTTTIASVTVPASTLKWSTKWITPTFRATLTPSTTYAIVLKGVGTTVGCFSNTVSQGPSNVYSAGIERVSTNSGSSWTTDSGWAMMFSTFPGPHSGLGKPQFMLP